MNVNLGWGLALLAFVAGYVGYGWRGVLLALTVVAFWLLLQFSRSLRVLRDAAGRPVGNVDNAVMLHAKLHEGMRLPQILKLTKSLGTKLAAGPDERGEAEETFAWADAAGDSVRVQLRAGRLATWTLQRAADQPTSGPAAPGT
ncbi:MAG: hypothetical protein HZC37_09890 [Burkholderiales bacterium]|nr:hypothetical protein [Burkholderiales bacterium]